ncbi:methionine aminopeptidase [Halalkalibacter kiskunsagensis]|uniref:Methionine aminopeptidase n=1 Tax=Halalkalibacter kiskunsagensis TaxID=1548599 RepID=A0ABV6KC66_9BACI
MGLFGSISQWTEMRKKKRIENFKSQGTCPNCQGKGFNILESEMMMGTCYDCAGCSGSGSFSAWAEINQLSRRFL